MTDAAQPQGNDLSFDVLRGFVMRGEIGLAAVVLGILSIMLVPLPPFLLDMLLAVSIIFSILVLMTALMIKKPLEFTAFPSVLLLATLLRLALNIASTRLILANGQSGEHAAGEVIAAFAQFVMGGEFVIGVIVFAILVIVNFVVITRGSTRIAEVAARFTLDSMPGKQMAIDADLSAGLINETQARERRKALEDESSFFGAMDGASKFVRGDAIAGLLIVFINIIGGIIIGVVSHGMDFAEAGHTYTLLTVGDGLVTQIPALIISVAAGLLVTKAGIDGAADKAFAKQLASYPVALGVVAACALGVGLLPGMPKIPFLLLAAGAGALAWQLRQAGRAAEAKAAEAAPPAPAVEETPQSSLAMDDARIEIGFALLPLINDVQGRRLTDQIKALRKTLAQDYGFVMPSVRILDNVQLPADAYAIRIREMDAGEGKLKMGHLLAMDPTGAGIALPGEAVKEPAFGLDAKWIDERAREEASFRGYTVVDPATVLATHLTEVIKEHMSELLTFSEVKKLIKELPKDTQTLLDDVAPAHISWSGVQRVLQNLLKERVSIRDLSAIIEAIAEAAPAMHDLVLITEHVRARLARQICYQHRNAAGALPILTLSPNWELAFAEALIGEGQQRTLALAPSKLHDFVADVRTAFEKSAQMGETPVMLTSPNIRPFVRSLIERFRPSTAVMGQSEVHAKVRLKAMGQI
ncbi:flagellar biosynthesis protein FlhA [Candidatus Viadribacter manganicus]|uniref:Flagellar biosynthesis protein FlhA n=1 Tax=Candidatus Viadribacter manganicus TaxID=1759059 RepID=A0A1B1AJE4_9PROT|nr:flagellar biosynthesis protein FlhA [Candidatus Viadribacter manganicus]ANP46682.1 flagellar biosynthesis protein FlhA [Candidatus Viadribacter manganicus]